jgi:hypothetical protein
MPFKPLTASERRQLVETLWEKAESDRTIMQAKDTSPGGDAQDVSDREVRSGIQGLPDATASGHFRVL